MSPLNLPEIIKKLDEVEDKANKNDANYSAIRENIVNVNNDLREIKGQLKDQANKQEGLFKIVNSMNTEFSMTLKQLSDKFETFIKKYNECQKIEDENKVERRKLNLTFRRTLIIVFFTAVLSLSTFITGQCVLEKYIKSEVKK
jgi:hypothetical protein